MSSVVPVRGASTSSHLPGRQYPDWSWLITASRRSVLSVSRTHEHSVSVPLLLVLLNAHARPRRRSEDDYNRRETSGRFTPLPGRQRHWPKNSPITWRLSTWPCPRIYACLFLSLSLSLPISLLLMAAVFKNPAAQIQ